jgi:hypothetical protein
MRFSRHTALLIILALAFPTSNAIAVTEEFIWQDRWVQAGIDFQKGYAIAIDDLPAVLLDLEFGSRWQANQGYSNRVPIALRKAHQCLHSASAPFTTIEQTTKFANQVMTVANDPQEPVAGRVLASLVSCNANAPDEDTTTDPAKKWEWKDRWDHEESEFKDGYASGLADLVRHLDNAGKQPRTLLNDISAATHCSAIKPDLMTIGGYTRYVRVSLSKRGDPLQSTAGAIFEILRVCGKS